MLVTTVSDHPRLMTKADRTPAATVDITGLDMREIVGAWKRLNMVSNTAVNKGTGTAESKTRPSLLGRESISRYLDFE
jgi:hypothetical protein